jgi:hypothetical protein
MGNQIINILKIIDVLDIFKSLRGFCFKIFNHFLYPQMQ